MQTATVSSIVNVFGMDVDVDGMEDCVLKKVLLCLRDEPRMNGRGHKHRDSAHRNKHTNHKDCLCIPFFGGA